MSRKIIYIINPISGTKAKSNLQQLVEEKTLQQNIPFQIFPSVANGDYSFLQSIIKKENITDIVIAGGDGTVSQVVGSLMNEEVNFGIIPCGSGNGLALAAKISRQPAKALEIIFSGTPVLTDGFFINERFACMLAGLGFDAKVAHDFTDAPGRGLLTYIKLSVKNFFFMKPHHFEIEMEKTKFETDAYFISIANSNQFGNNFTIAPRALLADGLLDIVIAKKTAKPFLLFYLIRQILTGKLRGIENSLDHPIIYFQTEKIKIRNTANAPVHIDGEPVETISELNIEVRKKCFRLIQPA